MPAEQQPYITTQNGDVYAASSRFNPANNPEYSLEHVANKIAFFLEAEMAIAASGRFDTKPGAPHSIQDSGLCKEVDPEIFFPEKGGSSKAAKIICSRCIAQSDCLESALTDTSRYGIWGNHTEHQLRAVAKRRSLEAEAQLNDDIDT